MNVSEYCFCDDEIIGYIKTNGKLGICDITRKENVPVIEIEKSEMVKETFHNIIEAYTDEKYLKGLPPESIKSRRDVFVKDWMLFSSDLTEEQINLLLSHIFQDFISDNSLFLDEKVGIEEFSNAEYMEEHAVLHISWNEFVEILKYKNRFWPETYINKNNLSRILKLFEQTIKRGEDFYRARICLSKSPFNKSEMGAPPQGSAVEGRLNPAGISRLYLSDSIDTTIHEIRASEYDNVCVGKFRLLRDVNVIDLRQINKETTSWLINMMPVADAIMLKEFLGNINDEIARPLRRDDGKLDYVTTQFIADFIESMDKIDGIIYKSTMHSEGFNLVLFDEKDAKCISNPDLFEIKKIAFEKEIV